MVPQLVQGFLHPQTFSGTGNPQRLHISGSGGRRDNGTLRAALFSPAAHPPASGYPPRCPAVSPKPKCPGEKRIGQALDANGAVETMPTVNDGGVGQRKEFGLDGSHESGGVTSGQVGAADRAIKEHVSSEYHPMAQEADTS